MTQEGYGQAYQQGFGRTVRLLRSRGASMDNAEDAAQAAWLRGWQKLDQLRDEGMIVSWVNSIAINCHRRESQDEARYQALPELCGRVGIDLAPLDVAKIDVAKILQFCRPRDRLLFEQQLGGLTTKEIARKEGVTETAIRIRILRARRAARARVEGRADCVSLSEFGSALSLQGRNQSRSARYPKLD
ncbi:MAG: sigma factor-like helix-turn-helix DNA-binding protein [Bryobacteraceae bacterium]